jgi:hypothetical protein
LVSDRQKDRDALESQSTAVLHAVAADLASLGEMANAFYSARYYLTMSCESYFADPAFFKADSSANGSCASSFVHAIHQLDAQIIAITYRLETAPVEPDTRERAEGLIHNYWSADGYRQVLFGALSGEGAFQGTTALTDCGRSAERTAEPTKCGDTTKRVRDLVGVHLQKQGDAVSCSILRDANQLRENAYDNLSKSTGAPPYKVILERMKGAGNSSCTQKLVSTPKSYPLPTMVAGVVGG